MGIQTTFGGEQPHINKQRVASDADASWLTKANMCYFAKSPASAHAEKHGTYSVLEL